MPLLPRMPPQLVVQCRTNLFSKHISDSSVLMSAPLSAVHSLVSIVTAHSTVLLLAPFSASRLTAHSSSLLKPVCQLLKQTSRSSQFSLLCFIFPSLFTVSPRRQHGSYSLYANPLARRAIAVSMATNRNDHVTHFVHPSRMMANARRRIRDPSNVLNNARSAIISHSHYNSISDHQDQLHAQHCQQFPPKIHHNNAPDDDVLQENA